MSSDTKEEPVNQVSPREEAGKAESTVDSNAGPSLASLKTEPKFKYEEEDLESEDVDDEEALLVAIEIEKEKEAAEEAAHPHEQPKEITAAPKLLQDALKKGEVTVDDSEEEESKEPESSVVASVATKGEMLEMATDDSATREEKKGDDEHVDIHYHARAKQLDFLLSKASEYSNFIANDLQELQESMTESAKRKLKAAEKKGKKRKSKEEVSASKRQKKDDSEAALKSAQDKHAKLRAGTKPIFVQPQNLSYDCLLKDYQLEGVRWLASLFENGVSGILADEMGLGKTIQVIALIGYLLTRGVSGPFLIVAPLATLPNWVREFEKWLPVRPVVRYHGTASEREALMRGPLNPKNRKSSAFPFIVTSYEVAIKDESKLERLCDYTYLIVDEGQRLKNHRCTLLSSLKRLKASNRLLLSGTPIQNSLEELWSLLNFVNPQIFDDLSVFNSWFGFRDIGQSSRGATAEDAILMEERKNQTVTKLHEILRPFLLRRVKTDVLLDLPPKKEIVVYSGISKLQAGYAELIDKGVLRDTLISQGIEQARTLSQTNKQMNHRKNVNHPFLFGEPIDPGTGLPLGTAYPHLLIRASGKMALLDRMLERLHKDKHQVLIFSQMTSLLNVIEDYLISKHWKYCRLDGSTHIDERQRQMDVFNAEKTSGENGERNDNDDRHFVFLLSTRAGGLGINLASADTCIIFDSDWNPHQDSQAMDRCHRIGQTRPVAVYRLLTANSVDIEMMEKQISKKKLERMTITGGDFRKAGSRSRGEVTFQALSSLLQDDIKNLNSKGQGVENIKIDDEEFELIMNRDKLFAEGSDAIRTEGKMYDVIKVGGEDILGTMKA